MEDEEDILKNIENKIKRRKIKPLQKFNEVIVYKKCEEQNKLLNFDVIYDSSGNPIAKINYKYLLTESKINLNLQQVVDKPFVEKNEDDDIFFDYVGFNSLNNENKIVQLINLDKIFYKQNSVLIDSIFMHKNINIKNVHKNQLEILFDIMYKEINKYKNLDMSDTKYIMKNINPCLELYTKINLTSLSFCLLIFNSKITSKLFYKVYTKIMYNINPKFLIDRLYINNSDYKLFRVKEFYKLHELTNCNVIYKIISEYDNVLIQARILFYMGKHLEGYLVLKEKKTILRYKLMYGFNTAKCLKDLRDYLYTYKHFLFYIWVHERQNVKYVEILYKEAVRIYDNIPCKLAHIRYMKKLSFDNFYEDCLNEEIIYENYLIKRKNNELSYKYLSKFKKKLIKKRLPFDLLEQEMCYLENKECKKINKFYLLYKYKINKKKNIKEIEYIDGDSLIIMYIYGIDIEILKTYKILFSTRNGFYWVRTRNIIDFKERLEESMKLFQYDQDF